MVQKERQRVGNLSNDVERPEWPDIYGERSCWEVVAWRRQGARSKRVETSFVPTDP
jgi:hypothetical protein